MNLDGYGGRFMNSEQNIDMYVASGTGALIPPRSSGSQMELLEVSSGSATVSVGTTTLTMNSGDIVYVPTDMMLRAEAEGTFASIRGVSFAAEILDGALERFDTEVLSMFYIQSRNNIAIFRASDPIAHRLSRDMESAAEEFLAKDVCYRLIIKSRLFLMISSILRAYSEMKNDRDRMIYHNVIRLSPVIDYIAEHFEEKIYVESLAEIINVTSDYFIKMFKDSIGKTPIDYINGLRVNKAMQYLVETDMPMSDISDKIGFCNANYFHKIFKQYTDVSPLAYRKSAK